MEIHVAMVKVEIVDTAFSHAPGMSWYNIPSHINWARGTCGEIDTCFFTDRCIGQAAVHPAKKKIALLIEPRCVDDVGLRSVLNNIDRFDHVLSYDRSYKEFIPQPGKLLWYPIGGCWIEEQSRTLKRDKTRLVSLIASQKNWAHGHKLRHVAAKEFGNKMDLWGRAYKAMAFKSEALSPYMFSVAIENDIVDDMFTEKLIDCFITGTVPIYWGTSSISRFFQMDGVLTFRTIEELRAIVDKLSPELYASMRPAVVNNFYRALQYRIAEDWIFIHYPTLFI